MIMLDNNLSKRYQLTMQEEGGIFNRIAVNSSEDKKMAIKFREGGNVEREL